MIPVVAAVVQKEGRFLLCQRPADKRHGGMWEFPGGKLLAGETLNAAARRELTEELGVCTTSVGTELGRFQDEGSEFVIHFLEVEFEGDPIAHEHQALGWFSPEEMRELPLAPADGAFFHAIHRTDVD